MRLTFKDISVTFCEQHNLTSTVFQFLEFVYTPKWCSNSHTGFLETFFLFVFFSFHRHQVAPAVASCAVRLWSSGSSEDQRSYQRVHGPRWRHALAGLLAGTGAVLAYGLHHHKVRRR